MLTQLARDPADAFRRYVYVLDDGKARELHEDECEFLATPFDADDLSMQPYVKTRYGSRSPGGSICGLLERRHLPHPVKVERRRDPARFTRPRPYARVPAVATHTLGVILAAALAAYLALIVGAFVALPFMRPGYRGLGIVLFVIALFVSVPFYLLIGPINVLLTADSLRFVRFFAATAGWLGAIAGAIWVLWLHGDPSRLLLYR